MKALHGLCIFLVGIAIPLSAQQPSSSTAPATPAQGAAQSSAGKTRQINLDVLVTDKSGKPQAGLQQQDFIVLDDKTPQNILSFSAVTEPPVKADAPVEIILLLDTVNTLFDAISDARRHLDKYLRQNGGKLAYPTSVAVFSSAGLKMGKTPSLDGNALSESLKANNDIGLASIQDAKGSSGATDNFVKSIGGLNSLIATKAKTPGRKIVIWISPGWPSLAGAEVRMGPKPKQDMFASVVAASTALRIGRITLYNINPEGSAVNASRLAAKFGYESFVKGVTSADSVSPANLSLPVLATQTGGRVLVNGNDIASQIQSCVDEANAFYTLSFAAAPTEHPDKYHSLELKVNKPGLTVRTSTGYYAQP
jgi:VWFA-related protein